MMVPALSASGSILGEPADDLGGDEDGFASILASLVGSSTPGAAGERAPVAVPEEDEPEVMPLPTTSAVDSKAGAETHEEPATRTDMATHLPTGALVGAEEATSEIPSPVVGSVPGRSTADTVHVTDTSPIPETEVESESRRPTSPVPDAGDAMIVASLPDPAGPAPVRDHEDATRVDEPPSQGAAPVRQADGSGPRSPIVRFDMQTESQPEHTLEESSSIFDDVSVGGDVAAGGAPDGPSARPEPAVEPTPPPSPQMDVDAAMDPMPETVGGAEADARVEAIREVVEWLESIGLESTPGEMRVEIPDGDGELIVRVTVVDGRLEVDASGTDESLTERWVDDLRRELDARGFQFAGSGQGRDGHPGANDDSGTAAEADKPLRPRSARPGVLL